MQDTQDLSWVLAKTCCLEGWLCVKCNASMFESIKQAHCLMYCCKAVRWPPLFLLFVSQPFDQIVIDFLYYQTKQHACVGMSVLRWKQTVGMQRFLGYHASNEGVDPDNLLCI